MNNAYILSSDNDGDFGTAETLYTACKAIAGMPGGNVYRDRLLVAFWNGHTQRVCPGFGATTSEREAIENDAGPLSAPPFVDVDRETAYGSTVRLSFAVRVF